MDDRTRILLVEDDPGDTLLVQRMLGAPEVPGFGFRLYRVRDLASGLERVASGDIDVVLLDLHLPDSRGARTVERFRAADPRVPIVVFTAAGADDTALAALQAGAQDYLVKGELTQDCLRRAIRYAIERQRLRARDERLQERLRRAQKAESLAVLAGGIAHDFNNLLTVILANASVVRGDLPEGGLSSSQLGAVVEAAREASRLTGELLAYSGGAGTVLEPLDVSVQIEASAHLLEKLVPANATLDLRLAGRLPPVAADASQLQQLAMNLVKNAGEALDAEAGTIELETGLVEVAEDTLSRAVSESGLAPGPAVYLSVRDSGRGMDPETLERIFDPFFSTRVMGRGLGLAACLGIVCAHGGAICVDSVPGEGTRFVAYFPLGEADRSSAAAGRPRAPLGTILVVEDDAEVGEIAGYSLERAGYRVRLAESGEEAIGLLRDDPDAIDLVLLDLVLPGIDGEETCRRLRGLRRDLPVLLASGYDPSEVARRFRDEALVGFLPKPYDDVQLVSAVAAVLAATPAAAERAARS